MTDMPQVDEGTFDDHDLDDPDRWDEYDVEDDVDADVDYEDFLDWLNSQT